MEIKDNRHLFKKRDQEEEPKKDLSLIILESSEDVNSYVKLVQHILKEENKNSVFVKSLEVNMPQKAGIDYLYMVANQRAEWFKQNIVPYLRQGKVVITDGYYYKDVVMVFLSLYIQAREKANKEGKGQDTKVEIPFGVVQKIIEINKQFLPDPDMLFLLFNTNNQEQQLQIMAYNELFRSLPFTYFFNIFYSEEEIVKEMKVRILDKLRNQSSKSQKI